MANKCEYVTKKELENDLSSIKTTLARIENSQTEMFNHFTERYEKMFKSIGKTTKYRFYTIRELLIFSGLCSLTSGLLTYLIFS